MRNLYPVGGTNSAGLAIHMGRMTGNGASAPTKNEGRGITFARTGTGTYTATLQDIPGGDFLGADVTLIGALADLRVNVTSYNAATGVLSFASATHVAFTATDLSSSYQVFVKLFFVSTVG